MKLSVMGLGLVAKTGTTGDLVQQLTQNDHISPATLVKDRSLAVEVPADIPGASQLTRRMCHFAKLSLSCACQAIRDAEFDPVGKAVGVIQGSVYGPIISGIQAFDDLIDFGDNQLSPTHFSGSVFNTAATYLTLAFGIQGCTLSHTSGLDTLYNSLLTAEQWLASRTVDYVLLGVGDEYAPYFNQALSGTEKSGGWLPTGEGWTTLILSQDPVAKYGQLDFERIPVWPDCQNQSNIYSVWHEQITAPAFQEHARSNRACWPVYLRGSYPSASAYDLALAILCAKYGKFPVYDAGQNLYQVENLPPDAPIKCYSLMENGDVAEYKIGLYK